MGIVSCAVSRFGATIAGKAGYTSTPAKNIAPKKAY